MRRIHLQHDADGPIEVVEEADGKLRSLQFGSPARQSTMFTSRPCELALEYTRSMAAGLLFLDRSPTRVLVLGLGGGSLPKYFLHAFPHCQVDVVERRQAVIDVAHAFFALSPSPRLGLTQQDGLEFLLDAAPQTYDLVCIDLHDAQGMSPAVDAEGFAAACRRVLRDRGVAVFNLWYGVRPAQEARLRRRLEQAFDLLLDLPVAGKKNCVAYGLTAPVDAVPILSQRAAADDSESRPLVRTLTELRRRYAQTFRV